MLTYVLRRLAYMIPTLILISIVAFLIIQLPPGDFLTTYVAQITSQGGQVDASELAALQARYGLGQPIYVQYWKWVSGVLFHLDFGQSFAQNQPVVKLIADRLPLTVVLAVTTLLFTWALSFPLGVYSAVRQYSIGDYVFTTLGFLGLAIPNFLLALAMMYVGFRFFGMSVGGLFSPEWQGAAWNLGKLLDLLSHLVVPVVVLGTAGTAALVRTTRAQLLDELHKPYVVAARARGIAERRMLIRYPLRVAINPFLSTVGWVLPSLVSGEVIVARVLSLPTTGPLLLDSLTSQDMYLAGSLILIMSVLTVIGTLLSDLLLGWVDPRVRLGAR